MKWERIYVWPNRFWLSFVPYIWFCKLLFMRCVGGEQWFSTQCGVVAPQDVCPSAWRFLVSAPWCHVGQLDLVVGLLLQQWPQWLEVVSQSLLPGPQVMGKGRIWLTYKGFLVSGGRGKQWSMMSICGLWGRILIGGSSWQPSGPHADVNTFMSDTPQVSNPLIERWPACFDVATWRFTRCVGLVLMFVYAWNLANVLLWNLQLATFDTWITNWQDAGRLGFNYIFSLFLAERQLPISISCS